MYSTGDWYAFRRVFGLTKAFPNGTLTQMNPASDTLPCTDPGISTANREATLDSEWVTATAPNANIVIAACANAFDPGVFIAMRNLLDSPNPPPIMSISYGQSEAVTGSAENAFIYSLYQQAVTEGVSVFVSAGDWGPDSFYNDRGTPSIHGLSVSGFASTPFNVAVGGTDFEDTYLNQTNTYWNTFNTPALASAKSMAVAQIRCGPISMASPPLMEATGSATVPRFRLTTSPDSSAAVVPVVALMGCRLFSVLSAALAPDMPNPPGK